MSSKETLRLFHASTCLGTIHVEGEDHPGHVGRLTPTSDMERYKEFFEFMTDEGRGLDEDPPFPPEFLDESMWFVRDDEGRARGISLPAVHRCTRIYWRWR